MYSLLVIALTYIMLNLPSTARSLNLPPAALVDFDQVASDKVPTSINSWHTVTSTVTVPYPTQTL